jgi:hypothetical protein
MAHVSWFPFGIEGGHSDIPSCCHAGTMRQHNAMRQHNTGSMGARQQFESLYRVGRCVRQCTSAAASGTRRNDRIRRKPVWRHTHFDLPSVGVRASQQLMLIEARPSIERAYCGL